MLRIIGLTAQRDVRAGSLSHGQKQWLEIGMLLMQNPRLLLVDEPVAGMTPQETERTAELLTSLAGEHTVIVVEHDMEFVRSIARRVTVLHQGSVLAEGSMDQVQANPKVVEVYLGEEQEPRMTTLQVRSLNQFYGGSHILWDIDTDIPQGAVTVLMGRNGMGKTTLLRCIMGLLPSASGQILFDGKDLRALPAWARAKHGIGYVPQGREIFSQLTVEENLRTGLAVRKARAKGSGRANGSGIPAHIYELFPVLKAMARRRGGDLSGGQQQQQLAIGRALVIDPSVLILDEPTEGIQPNVVHEIGDVILRLNKEQGLTVLLVEQKLPFARRVANELRILGEGQTGRIRTHRAAHRRCRPPAPHRVIRLPQDDGRLIFVSASGAPRCARSSRSALIVAHCWCSDRSIPRATCATCTWCIRRAVSWRATTCDSMRGSIRARMR